MRDAEGADHLLVRLTDEALEFSLRSGDEVSYTASVQDDCGSLYFDLQDLAVLCMRLGEEAPFENAEIANANPELVRHRDSTLFRTMLMMGIGPCYIFADKHRFRRRGVEQHLLIYRYLDGRPNVDGFVIVASAESFTAFARELLQLLCAFEDVVDLRENPFADEKASPDENTNG